MDKYKGERNRMDGKKRFLLPGIDTMLRGYNGKTPIYFVHKNKNEEDIIFIFEPNCLLLFLWASITTCAMTDYLNMLLVMGFF